MKGTDKSKANMAMIFFCYAYRKAYSYSTVIHTVKGFGIVNKAEIDAFLELSLF